MNRICATLTLIKPDAPNPCATRARLSPPRLCDSAQTSEASVITVRPVR